MDEVIDYLGENYYTGWVDDQEAVSAVLDTLQHPTLADTPIGDIPIQELPKTVQLWKFCPKAIGQNTLKVENQSNLGSCVGFGSCRAVEYSYIVEIANGDPEQFKYLSRAIMYAGSRCEVNGGKSPFRGDGSIGAWAAKFATKWGVLDQGVYAGYNLADYNIPQIRTWAATGIPDAIEPYIKQHPISDATLVATNEDAMRALSNGHAIAVCSNQGFNTKRSANGICAPSGRWSHCMMISGYIHIKDVLYFYIENSWGDYMGAGNTPIGEPNNGTFLAKGDVVASMLAQKDSFAFAGVMGFERKDIDWNF